MGQKVNPVGLRIGVIRDWESKWFAGKDYADFLHEDLKIREFISKRLSDASVSKVEIERAANRVNITIHTAKPGMVIGKGGSEVEALRKALNSLTGKRVHINILEIKRADLDAQLVAENIARQLENRISFRRAQNKQSNAQCVLEHKESKQWFLVVLAVQILLVLNITVKVLFHCTHFVLTSTMLLLKLILLMVSLA